MKDQKAFGLIKVIITFVILVAVVYLTIKLGTLGFNYHSLKDEMKTVAKFKAMETEETMKKMILEKAQRLGIELWEDDIIVDKYPGEKVVIDVYYEKDLVLPFYRRRFKFNLVVEEPLK